jgi:hypothetical protein
MKRGQLIRIHSKKVFLANIQLQKNLTYVEVRVILSRHKHAKVGQLVILAQKVKVGEK